MKTIYVTPKTKRIDLGKQGENLARKIIFNLSELVSIDVPDTYTVILLHKRNKDENPYPVSITQDGTTITWNPTSTDTGHAGYGEAELQIYVDTVLAKSITYETYVTPSLEAPGETPEPYQSWVNEIAGYSEQTKKSAIDTTNAAQSAARSADKAELSEQIARKSAESAENSLNRVSILTCNINEIGHLIVNYQNMDGFSIDISRSNGHLVMEV